MILSCEHEAELTDGYLERIADAASNGQPPPLPSRRRICPVCRRARDVVKLNGD